MAAPRLRAAGINFTQKAALRSGSLFILFEKKNLSRLIDRAGKLIYTIN